MDLGATLLRIFLSRWRLVAALVLGCTLAAWSVSVFYLAQKPAFEAAARLNIVPTSEELGYASRFVRGSTFDGGSVLIGTYAEFAHTRPIVGPIVDRWMAAQAAAAGQPLAAWIAASAVPTGFSPGRIVALLNYGAVPQRPLREELIDDLIEHTKVEVVDGTYLVRLSVEWEDGASAAWFANALADAVIARADRMSRAQGREIAGSLEDRLAEKQAALAETLRRARDLKASIGVVDVDRQKQSLLDARLTEQAALTTDRANLDAARGQVAALRRQAGGRLTAAQQTLEQSLAVEAPRADGLARSVSIRESRIAQLDRQLAAMGGQEDRIRTLDDQADALQREVAALTERVGFSRTENLANAPRIQLIERAIPPLVRSSPKVLLNTALGFVAGCALAACALLLLGPARPRPVAEEAHAAPADPIREPVFAMRPVTRGSAAPALDRTPRPAGTPPDRRWPGILPRPATGTSYDAAETMMLMRGLAPWLADGIADDAAPLFIGATGSDADAQQLYQLLYNHLRRGGVRVHRVDGTRAAADWKVAGAKPLVYLGGLAGSARGDVLGRLDGEAALVLAAAGAVPADWRALAPVPVAPIAHVVSFAG